MKKKLFHLMCLAICLAAIMMNTLSCEKKTNEKASTDETKETHEAAEDNDITKTDENEVVLLSDITDSQYAVIEQYFNGRVEQQEKDNRDLFDNFTIVPYTELMVYGAEQKGDSICVYLRALCHDFVLIDGEPFINCPDVPESSLHYAITADISDGKFDITDVKEPQDGDVDESSPETIFPQEIYEKISENDKELLESRMNKRVSEYYGCEVNDDELILNCYNKTYSIIDSETNKQSTEYYYGGEQQEDWYSSLVYCSERYHVRAEYSGDSWASGYYVPCISAEDAEARKLNGDIKAYIDGYIKDVCDEIAAGNRDFIMMSNYKCFYEDDILTIEISSLKADYATDMQNVVNKAFFYNTAEKRIMTADKVYSLEGLDREELFRELKESIKTDENLQFYFEPSYFTSPEQFGEIYKIGEKSVRIVVKDGFDLVYSNGSFGVCTYLK